MTPSKGSRSRKLNRKSDDSSYHATPFPILMMTILRVLF